MPAPHTPLAAPVPLAARPAPVPPAVLPLLRHRTQSCHTQGGGGGARPRVSYVPRASADAEPADDNDDGFDGGLLSEESGSS
jgi:hypothetical protein